MPFTPRQTLPHDVPSWVPAGSTYFITIHCAERDTEQLTLPHIASALLDSAAHLHTERRWFVRLFLLMPDHLHALLAFPTVESFRRVVSDWKRFTARQTAVHWQRDFFEHRIRDDTQLPLKADYIRANPVRKNLVSCAENWPWQLACEGGGGSPSRPTLAPLTPTRPPNQ